MSTTQSSSLSQHFGKLWGFENFSRRSGDVNVTFRDRTTVGGENDFQLSPVTLSYYCNEYLGNLTRKDLENRINRISSDFNFP